MYARLMLVYVVSLDGHYVTRLCGVINSDLLLFLRFTVPKEVLYVYTYSDKKVGGLSIRATLSYKLDL